MQPVPSSSCTEEVSTGRLKAENSAHASPNVSPPVRPCSIASHVRMKLASRATSEVFSRWMMLRRGVSNGNVLTKTKKMAVREEKTSF